MHALAAPLICFWVFELAEAYALLDPLDRKLLFELDSRSVPHVWSLRPLVPNSIERDQRKEKEKKRKSEKLFLLDGHKKRIP